MFVFSKLNLKEKEIKNTNSYSTLKYAIRTFCIDQSNENTEESTCYIFSLNKTQRSTMRLQATFHFFIFFIFLQLFHFFTLLVAPSSSPLFPPRPSFLLVPPSSLFLFLPRPTLPQSLRIHKRPFFIDFDESVTDGRTDQRTDGRTDGQGLL